MNLSTQEVSFQLRHTDDAHFDQDVASAPLVLVKFTGEWCSPCRALNPTLERLSQDRPELLLLSLDVDTNQDVAQRYGVRSIPTMIAFRDGTPVGQLVGNVPRGMIEKLLGD